MYSPKLLETCTVRDENGTVYDYIDEDYEREEFGCTEQGTRISPETGLPWSDSGKD